NNLYICKKIFIMTTAYHIKANELSVDFINALKTLFRDKDLFITVEAEMDETEYLLASEANRKMLLSRIKDVEKGKNMVTVNLNDL
ncbi:MAG: hypothetical protein COZ59_12675, partial [Bacteroidetes bacterium CG_4_8_14_3_um_filter_31_14]